MVDAARIGRYVLGERLGEGGMSIVHAAYDPELDRRVAIKLVRPDGIELGGPDKARNRLRREAQSMAQLNHPNVATVHEVGTHDGAVYLVMELVEGLGLDEWLGQTARTWREVMHAYFHAGLGLAAAHDVGIAHRDFKPSNVLIGRDRRVRVLDFGLARATPVPGGRIPVEVENVTLGDEDTARLGTTPDPFPGEVTVSGFVLGTPAYMAPELHEGGSTDLRADQFAYCVAFYEGLYGQRPFGGKTLAELAAQVKAGVVREAPDGTHVPRWLRNIVVRGLSHDPEHRHPTMKSLLASIAFTSAIMRG